jgi:CRP/FNR family transcriptional regulator, anaerobic regulatory protein
MSRHFRPNSSPQTHFVTKTNSRDKHQQRRTLNLKSPKGQETKMCIAGGTVSAFTTRQERADQNLRQPALKTVPSHDHVFFEGDARDCLYVVESGWVKLYRTLVDGQRQIVGFANGGSILGLESDVEYANGCEAITDVKVRAIPIARVTEICLQDGRLADQLLRQVGRQLGAAQAQIATVGAQSAEQKVANFLLTISDLCVAQPDGAFDLPMRRGDMAEFLGIRLETVSRKMTEFQRRGWIAMTSLYHCVVRRRDILEELAMGGEADAHPAGRAA